MDWFSYIFAGVLVYIAAAVFILGLIWQFVKWRRVAKSPIKLGMFPKPAGAARGAKLLKDTFFFPQVLQTDKTIWFFAGAFHLAGLMMFVGHLRLIREFTPILNWLGVEGMNQFAFLTGGGFGIILTVALIYYLFRRFLSPYKDLSVPEDYFLVILILLIVTMGNHLRFFGDVHVTDYREYVMSLLAFKPAFNTAIAASAIKWSLTVHVMLASVLLIYFPFSKLTHSIGAFAANLIRSE
jgi:nitrate reductase gamma subunit